MDYTKYVSKKLWSNDFYAGAEEFVKELSEAIKKAKEEGYVQLTIEHEEEYGSHRVVLEGRRLKTEEELAEEEKVRERQKEYRRRQYLQLKKEFG